MAAIVNQAALDAVNKAYNAEITALFGNKPPGHYQQFTALRPAKGTSVDHIVSDFTNGLREWIGPRHIGQLRAYRQNLALRKWEDTKAIQVEEVNGDVTGTVAEKIRQFVQGAAFYMDKIVIEHLLSNPTGYDGVSLLNAAHPNAPGTSNNLTTGALSFSAFKTGVAALEGMQSESGEPLNIYPTLLVVGPSQRELAMQITGSDKPVSFDNTGEPASSSTVTTALLPNYIGGSVQVVVSQRYTGSSASKWHLMDTSKPIKPMYCYEFSSFRECIKDRDEDDNVFFQEEILYGLSAHITPAAGAWQLVYGSTG